MMIGERNHSDPTVHVPPWSFIENHHPTVDSSSFSSSSVNGAPLKLNGNAEDYYPLLGDALTAAFQRYLPSNDDGDGGDSDSDFPVDAYSCDDFRMFEFKVRKCARGRSHDWTECPYAHPGEKARRRDPRRYHYSGTACPDFRKGNCKKGDGCEYAHGVFECWLHPARYRTQPCKDGTNCRRRVCFFAHTPDQLRVLSPRTPTTGSTESYDGSPSRLALEAKGFPFMSTLESVSPPSESPPLSPMSPMTSSLSRSTGSVNELVASLRQLQLNKVKSMPSSYGIQIGSPGFGSPRIPITRSDFCSLPSTPNRAGIGFMDLLDNTVCQEEPVMERVESGRVLRAKMFEKLSKENPLARLDPEPSTQGPDVGWVSELIQ